MRKTRLFIAVAAMILFASAYILPYAEMDENPSNAQATELPQPPVYGAGAVIVMCADTGMVLYGHEYHTPMYPASITKVMTALVVLDHVRDLSERIPFSYHAVMSIPRNSSHIAMDVGETLTVNQALNALMIRSANEVAIALAEYVAGTEEEFVRLMNARAQTLGAYNTYFTNPTGLPGVGHVTTAYDMALIMREALRLYPIFTNIISTAQFAIPPTERQPETRFLNNTHQMIRPGADFDARVVGGKTGWTHAAGSTLITYANQDGRRLIVTILDSHNPDHFRETTALLNFGFALPYEERVVFNAATYTRIVPVYAEADGERTEIYRLTLQAQDDKLAELPANFDLTRLRFNLTVQENIMAPVARGAVLGTVGVYVQNVRLGEVELLAQSDVELLDDAVHGGGSNGGSAAGGGAGGAGGGGNVSGNAGATDASASGMGDSAAGYAPPYAAGYYGLVYPQTLSGEGEYLAAMAVPLAVLFAVLLVGVFIFVIKRKRGRRHRFHGYSGVYRYRT